MAFGKIFHIAGLRLPIPSFPWRESALLFYHVYQPFFLYITEYGIFIVVQSQALGFNRKKVIQRWR